MREDHREEKALPVTGIILAGGKGLRFGQDKGLIKLGGQYLIERIIDIFKGLFSEIIIATNSPSAYRFTGLKTVKDIRPHKGPLVGIYSALLESSNNLNFVSGCDMPFINPGLIKYMIKKSKGYDIVIPSLCDGKVEPLYALYRKSCLCAIKEAVESNNARIVSFFQGLKVYKVQKKEIVNYDKDIISFFNINNTEDLFKAEEMLT